MYKVCQSQIFETGAYLLLYYLSIIYLLLILLILLYV